MAVTGQGGEGRVGSALPFAEGGMAAGLVAAVPGAELPPPPACCSHADISSWWLLESEPLDEASPLTVDEHDAADDDDPSDELDEAEEDMPPLTDDLGQRGKVTVAVSGSAVASPRVLEPLSLAAESSWLGGGGTKKPTK